MKTKYFFLLSCFVDVRFDARVGAIGVLLVHDLHVHALKGNLNYLLKDYFVLLFLIFVILLLILTIKECYLDFLLLYFNSYSLLRFN